MRRLDGRVVGLVLEGKALHIHTEDCMTGARWCEKERGHEEGACLTSVLSSIDADDTVLVIPTLTDGLFCPPSLAGEFLP